MIEGGQVDESEPMVYRTKPNEEAVIHILQGKEMDISSFSDHNSSTENETLDGKSPKMLLFTKVLKKT